jgi:CheY-like chemotaxis protein
MSYTAQGGWILVVDDHELSRRLLEQVLETAGLAVLGAGTITEAERLVALSAPDAVVLDMHLPDGHGLQLARRLRAEPRTANCAIIACTATDESATEQDCRRSGCDAYVTKPIDTHRFAEIVTELLGSRAQAPSGDALSAA